MWIHRRAKGIGLENWIATHSAFKAGIPATNNKGERLRIFVGIIDILQYYRLSKKIEHTFKSVIGDGVSDQKMIFF